MKRFEKGRHPWELGEWLRRRKLRAVDLRVEKDKAVLIVRQKGETGERGNGATGEQGELLLKVEQ